MTAVMTLLYQPSSVRHSRQFVIGNFPNLKIQTSFSYKLSYDGKLCISPHVKNIQSIQKDSKQFKEFDSLVKPKKEIFRGNHFKLSAEHLRVCV